MIVCRTVRLPVSGPRRHPGDADRRGGEARQQEARGQAVTRSRRSAGAAPGGPAGHARRRRWACRTTAARPTTRRAWPNGLPSAQDVTSVTFCGMGGSAVSGDVVRSVFLERLGLPVEVNRSPVLPEHCDPHTLVVVLVVLGQHGGDARRRSVRRSERGCRVLVVTSGGTIADEAAAARRRDGARTSRLSSPARLSGIWGSRRSARSRPWGSCRRSPADVDGGGRRDQSRARPRWDRTVPTEDNPAKALATEDRRSLPGHLGRRRHRIRGRRRAGRPR